MNIEPVSCTTTNNLWNRFVCWLHSKVEPLCEKDGNEFKQSNKLGIGAWRLFSYGTDCGCCYGFRVAFLSGVWWFVGVLLPAPVGIAAFVAVVAISSLIGHKFAKSKE